MAGYCWLYCWLHETYMKHIWKIYETHMKLVTDEKPQSLRCILMHFAEFDASSPLGLGPIMVFRFSWPLCPGRNPPKDSCRSYAESIRIWVDILSYVWFIFDSFFFIHGCIVKKIANAMAAIKFRWLMDECSQAPFSWRSWHRLQGADGRIQDPKDSRPGALDVWP